MRRPRIDRDKPRERMGERTITACARFTGAINVTARSGEQAPSFLSRSS
jgi:hypothetical protein